MGRRPCCDRETVNKGAWTPAEDRILANYISLHGHGNWRHLAQDAGLNRCGKSCRLRWMNYLRPDIKRGAFSHEEEDLIIRLHRLLGNRWALIARRIPGRTDNEIKNYWNSSLVKKLYPYPRVLATVTLPNERFNTRDSDGVHNNSIESCSSSTSEDQILFNLSTYVYTSNDFFLDLLLQTDNSNFDIRNVTMTNNNNITSTHISDCNEKESNVEDNEKESNNDCTNMSSPFRENEGMVMIKSSCDVDPNNLGVQTKSTFLSKLKKVASFLELEDHEWEL